MLPEQQYAVRGATELDQAWIDDTTEVEIAGCDRARPKPRPAEWDNPPAPMPKAAAPAAKKPRSMLDLVRGRS